MLDMPPLETTRLILRPFVMEDLDAAHRLFDKELNKEAKYDMAVGHLLLRSFWANEAIFQLMMTAYNLFLLFKMDRGMNREYRQQVKSFRLK